MRDNRIGRWFAAGITGTLFAILMLTLASPVAADGLVTRLGGQDPNSNVIVVASPGFIATNTATNPLTNGATVCTDPTTCGGTVVCIVNNVNFCGTAFCATVGCGVPTCAFANCGSLGSVDAGPIVAVNPNGTFVVYDVQGGTYDTYTRDANGRLCLADADGNCVATG